MTKMQPLVEDFKAVDLYERSLVRSRLLLKYMKMHVEVFRVMSSSPLRRVI